MQNGAPWENFNIPNFSDFVLVLTNIYFEKKSGH